MKKHEALARRLFKFIPDANPINYKHFSTCKLCKADKPLCDLVDGYCTECQEMAKANMALVNSFLLDPDLRIQYQAKCLDAIVIDKELKYFLGIGLKRLWFKVMRRKTRQQIKSGTFKLGIALNK